MGKSNENSNVNNDTNGVNEPLMDPTLSTFLGEDFGREMNGVNQNEEIDTTEANETNEEASNGTTGPVLDNEATAIETPSKLRKWNFFRGLYRRFSTARSAPAAIEPIVVSEKNPQSWKDDERVFKINSVFLANNFNQYSNLIGSANDGLYTKLEFMSQLNILEQEISSRQG